MNRRALRGLIYGGIALLFLLHNDLWLWNDGRRLLGLPIGLTYHIGYCVAAAALMLILVRRAWPRDLEVREREGEEDRG